MKNIAIILAFVLGTTLSLSAQLGSNPNSGTSVRGGSLGSNPNIGTSSRPNSGASSHHHDQGTTRSGHYGRPGSRTSSRNRGGGRHYHHNSGHNHHHTTTTHHHYNTRPPQNTHVHVNHGYTTTTTHVHHYGGYCSYRRHYFNWTPVCVSSFNTCRYSVRQCGFDNDRLLAAKRFIRYNHVSVHQVCDLMSMLSFESNRLALARYAFGRTCDIQNYHLVFNYLSFNSSRRALDCYIRDFYF